MEEEGDPRPERMSNATVDNDTPAGDGTSDDPGGTRAAEGPRAGALGSAEDAELPPEDVGPVRRLRALLREAVSRVWSRRVDRPAGNLAGRAFALVSVIPALVAAAWLLVAFPLLLAGAFHPWTALPLFVVVAVVAVRLVWRRVGGLRAPWWSLAATVAVVLVFAVVTVATHAQHVIIERDAGSYAQFGYWLAHHGSLPIRGQMDAFGGPDPRLSIESSAFYQQGTTIVPQFMAGWPLVLAAAAWFGGWTLLLSAPGIVGALAILAIAGLAARIIGPRSAPLVALSCALCFPILHMSQSTYSEPLALLLFFGGFCLLGDAGHGVGSRMLGLTAGLLVGAVSLVRLDAGRELSFLVIVAGWMLVRRRREAWPLLVGLALGGALGFLDGALLSRPYVVSNWDSVKLMGVLVAASAASVAIGVPLLRRVRDWSWLKRLRVPACLGVVLVFVYFAARPYFEEQHQYSPEAVVDNVARIQEEFGLPIDGTRTYGEYSLHWASWWLGWPAIAIAALGVCVVVWRLLQGRDLNWAPAFVVLAFSSLLILYRPGITPDHPWADRRLVPVVLPAMIMFGVVGVRATVAWFAASLRAGMSRPATGRVLLAGGGVGGLIAPGMLPPVGGAGGGNPPEGREPWPALASGDTARVGSPLWPESTRGACGPPAPPLSPAPGRGGPRPMARLGQLFGALALRLDAPLLVVLCLALTLPAALASKPLAFTRTELGEVAAVQRVCDQLRPTDAVLLLDGQAQWEQTIRGDCGVPVAALVSVTNADITYFIDKMRAAGHTVVLGAGDDPTPIQAYGLTAVHVSQVYFQWDLQSLTTRPDRTNLGLHNFWMARPGATPESQPKPGVGLPAPSALPSQSATPSATPTGDVVEPFISAGS